MQANTSTLIADQARKRVAKRAEEEQGMAAYVIGNVDVHDLEGYREYTKDVPATLAPFQGRFVVRAGAYETVEGEWNPDRLVLIEFPSIELARAWYASEAYQKILPIRHRHSRANFITFIEGVAS